MTDMHYWNKAYFEGLKEIGDFHIDSPKYHLFGNYCLLKEKGLKKQAVIAAKKFITELIRKSISEQRNAAIYLCELSNKSQRTHSLINHPIAKFIEQVLQNWLEEEPNSIIALRWYARHGPYELREATLEKALLIDPFDRFALEQSISETIYDIEYMTHHLDEGFLIGERSFAEKYLQKLSGEIPRMADSEEKNRFETAMNSYSRLFELLDIYDSIRPQERFVDWAKSMHKFDWFSL